jgi:hypothetical protein
MKKLTDARDYLRLWLERAGQVADAAPQVQRLHDLVDWEVRTYEQRPPEADAVPALDLDRSGNVLYERLSSGLPMLPKIDGRFVTDIGSATASTSSAMVSYVSSVFDLQTPAAVTYATEALTRFQGLREAQDRPEQVRSLLLSHMPNAVKRFDMARQAYERSRSRLADPTTVALEIRTFLDAIKGEVLERARRHAKENMTLEMAVERLFSSVATRAEIEEQLSRRRSALIDALSNVAKRRNEPVQYDLDALWSRALDHAFVVLNGIKSVATPP